MELKKYSNYVYQGSNEKGFIICELNDDRVHYSAFDRNNNLIHYKKFDNKHKGLCYELASTYFERR